MKNHSEFETIKINAGGKKFMTYKSTILRKENTLSDLIKECTENDIFIDEDSRIFGAILNYHRSGILDKPNDISDALWQNRIDFWNIIAPIRNSFSYSFMNYFLQYFSITWNSNRTIYTLSINTVDKENSETYVFNYTDLQDFGLTSWNLLYSFSRYVQEVEGEIPLGVQNGAYYVRDPNKYLEIPLGVQNGRLLTYEVENQSTYLYHSCKTIHHLLAGVRLNFCTLEEKPLIEEMLNSSIIPQRNTQIENYFFESMKNKL